MKKSLFLLGSVFLIFLIPCIGVFSAASLSDNLMAYEASINYNCEKTSDCEIKDVHSCCGYYPKCVNKNTTVNGSLVTELCQNGGSYSSGYCGYLDIHSCKCENNKCVGSEEVVNDSDYCDYDTDCACGTDIQTGKCFRGNKKYIDETKQCPDFCSGVAGDFVTVCVDNKCTYTKTIPGKSEVKAKILPETASQKARERLGELGFNLTLKEVGQNKTVYIAEADKEGKFLGLFKIKGKVSAEIDSETGEVIKINKPWWSFLAKGF